MTRVLFICCHDSFLHHADIRIDVLLRMSAVLRNHFDDSASDDDTVRNFCNVGRLICRVDAEAYGYRNIGYFADCGDHGIEVCLDLASDTGNKVLENSEYSAREAADTLCEALDCECVQVIGRKFVLFKKKKKESAFDAVFAK